MRSIRRSLTIYLLLLVAITLAGVWFVIDQAAQRALAAREEAGRNLIQARYEDNVRREWVQLDQSLFDKARQLANMMQWYYGQSYESEAVKFVAVTATGSLLFLTTQPALWAVPTQGSLTVGPPPATGAPPFPTTALRRPLASHYAWVQFYFENLPLPEELIQHFDDDKTATEHFQINTTAGREWRSRSLGNRKLPLEVGDVKSRPTAEPGRPPEPESLIDWSFSTVPIQPDGELVRRVVYKVPYVLRPPPRRREWPPRSLLGTWGAWAAAGGIGLPPVAAPNPQLPRFYVQAARPLRDVQSRLDEYAAVRERELAELADDIHQARQQLRQRIAGVGLIAFAAVLVGGPLLVSRGLHPLGKLSEAVSRVSEKDFRLPHDGADLTRELLPIHARLTQTLELLRRAFAREKQAVADISHELRTPIAALLATIDVVLMKPRPAEQYRAALEESRLIAHQLGQLVERIMTLASLDAGNDQIERVPLDVHELAAGCVAVLRPLATANQITIDWDVPEGLSLVTDPTKLREILMNLLHNAIEYNKPGGLVELHVYPHKDHIILEVRDTGIGMSPEVMDKIFERFYRADPSRQATGVHAGLGLAIVKEYVERLGGTIEVESTLGQGSLFRVRLPRPAGDASASRPAVTAGTV